MIQFENVSKIYGDGTAAVEEFSLIIPSHHTTVLVGSSGSGKTTLLRMVNRMVEPSAGRVLIDDEDVANKNPVHLRRRIGYVLQQGGLLPHRTVAENIATVRILNGVSKREARAGVAELLERVGLDPSLSDRYPAQLSGGQQQRVGVARALAPDPNILLMDEPFGAVDPIVRRELQDELLRLQRELGKTILFVTHDTEEAFRLGDEVVVMKNGGVIAQRGTPDQIIASPADDFVRYFIGADAKCPNGTAEMGVNSTAEVGVNSSAEMGVSGTSETRILTTRDIGGQKVVFDPAGRRLGVVAS